MSLSLNTFDALFTFKGLSLPNSFISPNKPFRYKMNATPTYREPRERYAHMHAADNYNSLQ